MITKFKVSGYRGFENEICFDFSSNRDYAFNTSHIKNDIINKALLYGKNASGKSNLGFALFDIVQTISSKQLSPRQSINFLNANSNQGYAEFIYSFLLGGINITYLYRKKDFLTLSYERVEVNNKLSLEVELSEDSPYKIKHIDYDVFPDLKNLSLLAYGNKSSCVKYIINSNHCSATNPLKLMGNFVERMIWFRNLQNNDYIGYTNGIDNIANRIVAENKLEDFEQFLNKNSVNLKLFSNFENGINKIYAEFKNSPQSFETIASNGTLAFELLFYWKTMFEKEKPSFVFIDEFDAYYHFESAKNIYLDLCEDSDYQVLLTTHNTYLMRNDISRPDCVFLIQDNASINPLINLTEKELREGHNIEKMFRVGVFDA